LQRVVADNQIQRRFDRIRFRGPGTDLTVGLMPRSNWCTALEETVDGRTLLRYDYQVPYLSSGYKVKTQLGQEKVAYRGSLWADPRTLQVRRGCRTHRVRPTNTQALATTNHPAPTK
jgi:hypothetical protein